MNAVLTFLEECYLRGPTYTARVGHVYDAYVRWCERGRERCLTKRQFNIQLQAQGCEQFRGTGNVPFWRGIGLQTAE